jgi:hypothetical protein
MIPLETLENTNPDFQALTPIEQQVSRRVLSLTLGALLHDPSFRKDFTEEEVRETLKGLLGLHVSGAFGRSARETLSFEEMTVFTPKKPQNSE